MKKNEYLFYSDYLKNRNINNKAIMIAKTNNSYLVGPLITSDFYEESFYKRIKSNSIYNPNIYKKFFRRKNFELIEKFEKKLGSNQIIEIYKNGEFIIHSIIKVPGDINEKK